MRLPGVPPEREVPPALLVRRYLPPPWLPLWGGAGLPPDSSWLHHTATTHTMINQLDGRR